MPTKKPSRTSTARRHQPAKKAPAKTPPIRRTPAAAKKPATPRKKTPSSTPEGDIGLVRNTLAGGSPWVYDPTGIEDAPEFNALSRAMGTMTWGTWDSDERPYEERLQDFLLAYPPNAPVERIGGRLQKQPDGSFAPGNAASRLERFLADGWDHGSLHELLSRFGLRMRERPPLNKFVVHLDPLRDVAKRRNVRLRVLHGGVDVEPMDMDAAKAEYIDRQEKKQAAQDVRAARARMHEELAETSEPSARQNERE